MTANLRAVMRERYPYVAGTFTSDIHALLDENERLDASYADATTLVDSWIETASTLRAENERLELVVKFEAMRSHGLLVQFEQLLDENEQLETALAELIEFVYQKLPAPLDSPQMYERVTQLAKARAVLAGEEPRDG